MSDRALARRPPRRADHVVVEDDDAVRASGGRAEALGRGAELGLAQAAALVAVRSRRVQADDVERCRRVRRLGRLPQARSNSRHGAVNRAGNVYGRSWLPGTATHRQRRARRGARGRARARSRRPRLVRSPEAMTRSGLHLLDERAERRRDAADPRVYPCGDRKRAGCVRSRAKEAIDSGMADETAEDLRRPLPRPAGRRRPAQAAPRRAADDRGARGARPLAAALDLAQGVRDRRLRHRHLRARLHPRRPRLRPLAQGVVPGRAAERSKTRSIRHRRNRLRPEGERRRHPSSS